MRDGEMDAAWERLDRGRLLLNQQRKRVALQEAQGGVPSESRKLLKEMERVVQSFEEHLGLLRWERELETPSKPAPL